MNIWTFLLQTLSVSLCASFLLFIKFIFRDKLSPLWQYLMWMILACRILVPVHASRYVLLPLAFPVNTVKNIVESRLSSAYSAPFIDVTNVFTKPQSITDILFIIYLSGVVITLLRYVISYIRLSLIVRRAKPVNIDFPDGFHGCKVVLLRGIPTPFVCGILRPVLCVPSENTDKKIIMHELMHLKYRDSLQNALWYLLRALHWCNPYMHYVFNIISNDIEALCDNRVLEMLEGEERREYADVLLSVACGRYARAVGTTSISNGAKNISRRIEAVARFKKYPKGIGYASVCIIIALFYPLVIGTPVNADDIWHPDNKLEITYSLSCVSTLPKTPEGAIDAYAKSVINSNGIMRFAVLPESEKQAFAKSLVSQDSFVYDNDRPENVGYTDYMVYNFTGDKAVVVFDRLDRLTDCVTVEIKKDNSGYTVIPTYEEVEVIEDEFGNYAPPVYENVTKTTLYGSYNLRTYSAHSINRSTNGIPNMFHEYEITSNVPLLSAKFKYEDYSKYVTFKASPNAPSKPSGKISIRCGTYTSSGGIKDGKIEITSLDSKSHKTFDTLDYKYELMYDGVTVDTVNFKE